LTRTGIHVINEMKPRTIPMKNNTKKCGIRRIQRTISPMRGMPHRRFCSSVSSNVRSIVCSPPGPNGGYLPVMSRT